MLRVVQLVHFHLFLGKKENPYDYSEWKMGFREDGREKKLGKRSKGIDRQIYRRSFLYVCMYVCV